jgi:hypothetical protein
MATTINDVFNSTDVLQMYNNARYYAMDNFDVTWAESEKWVAENLPEVQRIKEGNDAGTIDIFGNYVDAPGYTKLDSINNPMRVVNMPEPDAPVNVVDTSTPVVDNSQNIITDSSPNSGGDNILSDTTDNPLTSMFELNKLYREVLGRDFTDGNEIFNYYSKMSPEAVREELYDSPEAQIYRQATGAGGTLSPTDRAELLGIAQTGFGGILDVNEDGVVNIDDLIIDMGRAGIGENILPLTGTVGDNTQNKDAQIGNVTTDTGFGSTPMVNALAPYYKNLVRMQITPGSNILDAPVSGNFFGIDPATNQVGILSDPTNTDIQFRSGASGFTEQRPTGFEFGIPAFIADVPMYLPKGYENFLEEQEAKEAEANSSNNPRRFVTSTHG